MEKLKKLVDKYFELCDNNIDEPLGYLRVNYNLTESEVQKLHKLLCNDRRY